MIEIRRVLILYTDVLAGKNVEQCLIEIDREFSNFKPVDFVTDFNILPAN